VGPFPPGESLKIRSASSSATAVKVLGLCFAPFSSQDKEGTIFFFQRGF